MSFLIDWRAPSAPEELCTLERTDFAWEFLRRNPDYRRDHSDTMQQVATGALDADDAAAALARRWGLHWRG